MASRHLCRMIALQSLYEWDFWNREKDINDIVARNLDNYGADLSDKEFPKNLVNGVVSHIDEIDEIITKSAPERPLAQINIVDRNILRMGLFEVLLEKADDVPVKVAINESVELAKNYGGDKSYSFVNGVLGTVFRTIEGINEEVKEEVSEVLEEVVMEEEKPIEENEDTKVFEEKE